MQTQAVFQHYDVSGTHAFGLKSFSVLLVFNIKILFVCAKKYFINLCISNGHILLSYCTELSAYYLTQPKSRLLQAAFSFGAQDPFPSPCWQNSVLKVVGPKCLFLAQCELRTTLSSWLLSGQIVHMDLT